MNKDVKVIDLKRSYDKDFVPSKEYLDSMPDVQNSEFIGLPIEFVGISGMRVPVRIKQREGGTQEVLATVSGMVDVDSHRAGLNMSRIYRQLGMGENEIFDINRTEEILRRYKKSQQSLDAHILINFKYRIWQESLRSVNDDGTKPGGWYYINCTIDTNIDKNDEFKKILWVDYLYSSTCVCSTELTFMNMYERGHWGAPHSQRSVVRVGVVFEDMVWIEDIIDLLKSAVGSMVQIHVKREDEQAFSELCGTPGYMGGGTVFVEDAARLFANALNSDKRITDWICKLNHAESLHPWSAVGVITKGVKGSIFKHHVTQGEWNDLLESVIR